MSRRPEVSIVMPTYNRLRFLPAAVQSIFAQTFRDWELIVADDGSSELVLEYLRIVERRGAVRVLKRAHVGNPGAMRNAAIAEARAPLLAFMDSDDLWAPTKLEKQLARMRAEPACLWSYTGFAIVDAADQPLPSERERRFTAHAGDIFEQVVRGSASIRTPAVVASTEVVRGSASIRTPAVVASTEVVREVGAFDEAIDCAEDYDLWARLALRSPVCVVDEPLVRVRRYPRRERRVIGTVHAARDHSLAKLARELDGRRRALLEAERARNALGRAAAIVAHGERRRGVATLASSLRFSWRYPGWWYGAAKCVARACVGHPIRRATP